LFEPYLNYSRVTKYIKKVRQPNEELSRLLKALNRKTQLFPDVRSVILGFYTEIDENEEGLLEEYVCVVIAVNVNDHDKIILKSCQKLLSRRGENLRDHWKIYESDCNKSEMEANSVTIVVFTLDNIVYEFVCQPNLLKKFETDKSILCNLKLENQNVLALENIDVLPLLLEGDGHFLIAEWNYLRYRAPDLRPISQLEEVSIREEG